MLKQVGGLHGVIRWFKFILRVFFFFFRNCEWILLSYM